MLRFVVVGASATAIHYGVYWLLLGCLTAGVAYTIGYLLSFVFNYLMSSRFTFRSKVTWRNALGFCMAHGLNYALHMVLLAAFLHWGMSARTAPFAVYAIVIPLNFILVRLVFRHKRI